MKCLWQSRNPYTGMLLRFYHYYDIGCTPTDRKVSMGKRKHRNNNVESSTALVRLSMSPDEASCRAVIHCLEKQLRRARELLAKILKEKRNGC